MVYLGESEVGCISLSELNKDGKDWKNSRFSHESDYGYRMGVNVSVIV